MWNRIGQQAAGKAASLRSPALGTIAREQLSIARTRGSLMGPAADLPGAVGRGLPAARILHVAMDSDIAPALHYTRQWKERADPERCEDVFRMLRLQNLQRTRWHELATPAKPGLASDPVALDFVAGTSRGFAAVVDAAGPAVVKALELLRPWAGDVLGFDEPPDFRLLAALAAFGCRCEVRLRDFEAQQGLSDALLDLRLAERKAGTKGRAQVLDLISRVRLLPTDAAGVSREPEPTPLKAVFALGTYNRLASRGALQAEFNRAASRLLVGGGLVFDFAHAASGLGYETDCEPVFPSFAELQPLAKAHNMQLRHLVVTCQALTDAPPTDRTEPLRTHLMLPSEHGALDLAEADRAAWDGWRVMLDTPKFDGVTAEMRVAGAFTKAAR